MVMACSLFTFSKYISQVNRPVGIKFHIFSFIKNKVFSRYIVKGGEDTSSK